MALPILQLTRGLIYRATGNDVTLIKKYICDGRMVGPDPKIIHNGQCAGFQHANHNGDRTAAVVYRNDCDWMFAWNITEGDSPNHVYTKIGENGDFDHVNYQYIRGVLKDQPESDIDTWKGHYSSIEVGTGSSPQLKVTMISDE